MSGSGVPPEFLRVRPVHSSCNSSRIGAVIHNFDSSFSEKRIPWLFKMSSKSCSFFVESPHVLAHSLAETHNSGSVLPFQASAIRSNRSHAAPYPAGPRVSRTSVMAAERQNELGCFIQRTMFPGCLHRFAFRFSGRVSG